MHPRDKKIIEFFARQHGSVLYWQRLGSVIAGNRAMLIWLPLDHPVVRRTKIFPVPPSTDGLRVSGNEHFPLNDALKMRIVDIIIGADEPVDITDWVYDRVQRTGHPSRVFLRPNGKTVHIQQEFVDLVDAETLYWRYNATKKAIVGIDRLANTERFLAMKLEYGRVDYPEFTEIRQTTPV